MGTVGQVGMWCPQQAEPCGVYQKMLDDWSLAALTLEGLGALQRALTLVLNCISCEQTCLVGMSIIADAEAGP